MEAIGPFLACRASVGGCAFAVVALNDQASGGVNHVEVTNRVLVSFKHVFPMTAGPFFGGNVKLQHTQVVFAIDVFKRLSACIPHRTFEQGVEFESVFGGRHAFKTLGATDFKRRQIGWKARCGDGGMVRRADHFAVHQGFEHGQNFAIQIGLDQVGPKLVPNPQVLTNDLKALGVEVRACQVALGRAFMNNAEGHFLVRIMQKRG